VEVIGGVSGGARGVEREGVKCESTRKIRGCSRRRQSGFFRNASQTLPRGVEHLRGEGGERVCWPTSGNDLGYKYNYYLFFLVQNWWLKVKIGVGRLWPQSRIMWKGRRVWDDK